MLLLLDVIGLIGVINAIDISDVIENVGDIDVLTCRYILVIVITQISWELLSSF